MKHINIFIALFITIFCAACHASGSSDRSLIGTSPWESKSEIENVNLYIRNLASSQDEINGVLHLSGDAIIAYQYANWNERTETHQVITYYWFGADSRTSLFDDRVASPKNITNQNIWPTKIEIYYGNNSFSTQYDSGGNFAGEIVLPSAFIKPPASVYYKIIQQGNNLNVTFNATAQNNTVQFIASNTVNLQLNTYSTAIDYAAVDSFVSGLSESQLVHPVTLYFTDNNSNSPVYIQYTIQVLEVPDIASQMRNRFTAEFANNALGADLLNYAIQHIPVVYYSGQVISGTGDHVFLPSAVVGGEYRITTSSAGYDMVNTTLRVDGTKSSVTMPVLSKTNISKPTYPDLIAQGNLKLERGDLAGAIFTYTQAIEMDSGNPQAYQYRGQAKDKLGDPTGASADYAKAAELNDKALAAASTSSTGETPAPKGQTNTTPDSGGQVTLPSIPSIPVSDLSQILHVMLIVCGAVLICVFLLMFIGFVISVKIGKMFLRFLIIFVLFALLAIAATIGWFYLHSH